MVILDPDERNPEQARERASLTLLRLQSATTAYLEVLRLSLPDVVRLGDEGRFLLSLTETALLETEWGTPGSIGMALREVRP